ncbi:unnamed protein product [Penicillium salamii]|uniref:Uncharacterized protein n=1 Tax=Penicillium salamii TaxID=1612424 RepID=A0A9W4K2B0_9EURO|nr:unnamed protein product [Penicillium salamii]CAG7953595.1 unnamed protein product [Penicillium salamii]CAG7974354.1 unnamed protein product [Penicillium salamii]CAG8129677.1 unnamed protein product [Penicillium salamii]CAG8136407.1 unnamed protein product [Penicillium salamii]
MAVCASDPIIIVGSAQGLSTALHLAQRGYTNISVFAKDGSPRGITVQRAAQDAGVRFIFDQPVEEIVYVSTLTGKKNAGVRTRDAQFYPSSLVIIETGGAEIPALDQFRLHDSLATPLSWFTSKHTESLVDFVPQESSSVILLSGDPRQGSKLFSLVGSLVLDLLGATSDQQAVNSQNLSQILPPASAKL